MFLYHQHHGKLKNSNCFRRTHKGDFQNSVTNIEKKDLIICDIMHVRIKITWLMGPVISEGSFKSIKTIYHLICLTMESSEVFCFTSVMCISNVEVANKIVVIFFLAKPPPYISTLGLLLTWCANYLWTISAQPQQHRQVQVTAIFFSVFLLYKSIFLLTLLSSVIMSTLLTKISWNFDYLLRLYGKNWVLLKSLHFDSHVCMQLCS